MVRRAVALVFIAAVAAPAAAQADTLTIQVTSVVVKVTAHDRAPRGTSTGDTVLQRNKLLNARRQFGKVEGDARRQRPGHRDVHERAHGALRRRGDGCRAGRST